MGLTEAIAQLRDGIRTGLSVQEALAALARNGPEVLRPEFGGLVRDLRREAGLTQVELAERMGVAQPEVARLEAGGSVPQVPTLARVARGWGS